MGCEAGWAIMGWAFLSNLWGQVAYLALESILHVPPFPSIADVGTLGFYPLMLWGLLSFPRITKTREERLRFWFDASIILIGCGMVLWHFIVGRWQRRKPPIRSRRFSVAYIVGDIVLLFGIATILLRRPDSATQVPMYLVTLGLLSICVADVAVAYLGGFHAYQSGDSQDGFWTFGMYLLAVRLTIRIGSLGERRKPCGRGGRRSPLGWLPYLMIVMGYLLLVWVARTAQSNQIWELILGAVLLTALVMTRQVASARENSRLMAQITERRGEARMTSLLQNLVNMIAVCDATGRLFYWSPSLSRTIRWEPGAEIDRSFLAAVHPSDEARIRSYLQDVSNNPG